MSLLSRVRRSVSLTLSRNIGFSAIIAQKAAVATDPIQKLFIQKVKEYDQKSKSNPGKLVDPTPEIEKEFKQELDRVSKVYGGGSGIDMTKFPAFDFKDPHIDPISMKDAEAKK